MTRIVPLLALAATACSLLSPDNRPPEVENAFPPWAAHPTTPTVILDLDEYFVDPDLYTRLSYTVASFHPAVHVETTEYNPHHGWWRTELTITPVGVPPQTTGVLVTAVDPAEDSASQVLTLVFPSYAILPVTAHPPDTFAMLGDTLQLDFDPMLEPKSEPCIEGNPEKSLWPSCDDLRERGWLIYETGEWADLLDSLTCKRTGGGNIRSCWSITVGERLNGPGLKDLGHFRWAVVKGCLDTWAAVRVTRFYGAEGAKPLPHHRIFTDTTQVAVGGC